MALKWSDVDELAQALENLYPQTDLSVLEYGELQKMAAGVDGFDDSSVPDNDDMEAVINAWIGIQFPEEPEKVNSENIE
ncbi:MAG: Fe-S cluster assembly protein IscX [Alphaproteobacteria bacterium]|nr:Fe-S cluster assembly protein IscX [Alphaproteobacteria bacterium]MBQ8346477.1 Fe-S cluster assembly protein IscX [Alphaproteobacteria bacterium]